MLKRAPFGGIFAILLPILKLYAKLYNAMH